MAAEHEQIDESSRNVLGPLTAIERVACGFLIMRQINHGPTIGREIAKYGPDGSVKLCSARAIGTYTVLLGIIGAGLAAGGVTLAAIIVFVFVWLTAILAVGRSISAGKAGRRWRTGPSRNMT
jgi:hypothetical protein